MKKLSTFNSPFGLAQGRQLPTRNGFTLIELLIVIAIIGVLATILLANFIGVRQRSRDAQRKADLRQIQSAIELYKADQGTYPNPPLYSTVCPTSSSLTYPQTGTPIVTYMRKLPCDPSPSIGKPLYFPGGNYYYTLSGSTYQLLACIENTNDTDPNVESSIVCFTGKVYSLTNP